MIYKNTIHGSFCSRKNRFVAEVMIEGRQETVHVKNTSRCRELLLPGAEVVLERAGNSSRKTKYDLISVYKESLGWVNIDSQAPNKIVREWLEGQDYDVVRPEYTIGTLELDGIGYFPDAPTERGIKHLRELKKAAQEGYQCYAAFVIQMEGITEVRPNIETHREFGQALEEAENAGVKAGNIS